MADAVKKHLLPLGVTLADIDRDVVGGYFVWIALPELLQAEEVALRAKEDESLIIAPGTMFEVSGDDQGPDLKGKVRLCFSWEEENVLHQGIERLGQVIGRIQDAQGDDQGAVGQHRIFDAGDFR